MEFKSLKQLCIISKGATGISKAIPGEFPLVVTSEARKSNNEYQFDAKAVIVPLVSSTGHGHASLKRIHYQEGKFALGSILCAIIPKNENILNAKFLYHFLNLNKEHELVKRMKGMANVTLSIKEIEKIKIPILSLEEQLRFTLYYSKIENFTQDISREIYSQLDKVKYLRQSFLSEALQGRLVNNETSDGETGASLLIEIQNEKEQLIKNKIIKKSPSLTPINISKLPFDIPLNWAWCKFGEISNYGSSLKIGPHQIQNNTWILDLEDIEKVSSLLIKKIRYPSRKTTSSKSIFKKGQVLYSKLRPNLDKVIVADENGICTTEIVPIQILSGLNSYFIRYFLKSSYFINYAVNATKGMKMPRVGTSEILNAIFTLPPLEIQERIVTELDKLMTYCDDLEESIKNSQFQNEQLLQQVLREALGKKQELKKTEDQVIVYDDTIANKQNSVTNTIERFDRDINKELAAIVYLMKNGLGISYGEVAIQKTIYNATFVSNLYMSKSYQFTNYHYGTYSNQLRDDLNNNPYLKKEGRNGKEVFILTQESEKQILDLITDPINKGFVRSLNELIEIYNLPFINKKTEKIELFNTVLKVATDLKTKDIESIYQGLKDWKIEQKEFKSKAEKFNKEDTEKMLKLLMNKMIL